jgi:hypothetical protein
MKSSSLPYFGGTTLGAPSDEDEGVESRANTYYRRSSIKKGGKPPLIRFRGV